MIETWVLVIWISSCIGDDCPIKSWVATQHPTKTACEVDLKVWTSISDDYKGVCLWGILKDLEPDDE